MTGRLSDDGGYSLIELLVVMALLSVVVGGIVTLFASGLNSEADQNRRFQAQQDGRLALDKLRREVHSACTISTPNTYNTALSSVTIYFPSDNCRIREPQRHLVHDRGIRPLRASTASSRRAAPARR